MTTATAALDATGHAAVTAGLRLEPPTTQAPYELAKKRFSFYEAATPPPGQKLEPSATYTLEALDRFIRQDVGLANKTEAVRKALAAAGGNKKDDTVARLKKSLPGIPVSARGGGRKKADATMHTGFVQADFDHVAEAERAQLVASLTADPHVALVYRSATTGAKAFFVVQPPDAHDPESFIPWHEGIAFPAVEAYCRATFGRDIDTACKDITRFCFLASDPEAAVNFGAVPFTVADEKPRQTIAAVTSSVDQKRANTKTVNTAPAAKRQAALAKSVRKDDFRKWALDRGFKGDLRTLDLPQLVRDAGLVKSESNGRLYLSCPWEAEHSTGSSGTDVVLFTNTDNKAFRHGFKCQHEHCQHRDVLALLDYLEKETPGSVDGGCSKQYEGDDAAAEYATDAGRAERFIARFGQDVRFVPQRKLWFTWEDGRWTPDTDGAVKRLAVELHREMLTAAAALPGHDETATKAREAAVKKALAFGDRRNIEDYLTLAEIHPRIVLQADKLDADPWVVGAPNAIIDLKTGLPRLYTRADFITRTLACDVDPSVTCPRWDSFMEEVFPDEEVRRYVWKAAGYCLTGEIREQCFFFLWGIGRNGKSTFIKTLEDAVFGLLSVRAGRGIVAAPKNGRTPNDEVAELAGARVILTSETEEGERLNEGLIKDLTGGESMRGRFVYGHGFRFMPTGKLWVVGNHRPVIRGTDDGVWRRVRLVGFTERFDADSADRGLPDKLKAEASGILNWLIRGCLLWQEEGLEMPGAIAAAVDAYRNEEDRLADFIDDKTVEDFPSDGVKHSDLFSAYQSHAEASGNRYPLNARSLARALRDRGWKDKRTSETKIVWQGLRLVR